jgi:ParB-like chromosome segregation protein Spo0J
MSSHETREWIATLKASILARGLDKPISIRYERKTGTATLVDGQCRLMACRELWDEGNKVYVKSVVVDGDEAELTIKSMVSNSGQPLTQWEIGAGCRRLIGWSWTVRDIAAHICKPVRYVTEAIALSNVPLEAKTMLAAGEATPGAVLHAVQGKDGDSLPALKKRVDAAPKPQPPAQKTLPGSPVKAPKPQPVARPKAPSAKEEAMKKLPTVLELADAACKMILDDDATIGDCQKAARMYLRARQINV